MMEAVRRSGRRREFISNKSIISIRRFQTFLQFACLATLGGLGVLLERSRPSRIAKGPAVSVGKADSPAKNYHAFRTAAKRCPDLTRIPDDHFKSQSGEDRKLMRWFGTLCGGSYIEMGGLDGVHYSNSYAFNKGLGWKGVLVELMKHSYDELVKNRPDEIATINAGVCDVPQTLHYYAESEYGELSGIYEFTTQSFRDQYWGEDFSLDHPGVHEIQCDTLDGLLLENAPGREYFDFFSLDVEGAELAALNSIAWDRVGFGVILVEADGHNELKNSAVRALIESRGYIFLEEHERSYWFMNSRFHEIYKDLVH